MKRNSKQCDGESLQTTPITKDNKIINNSIAKVDKSSVAEVV